MPSVFDMLDKKYKQPKPIQLECVTCHRPKDTVLIRSSPGNEPDAPRCVDCWREVFADACIIRPSMGSIV